MKYNRSRQKLEKKLGRKLKPGEICHHKDHNPENDAEDNLEAITKEGHDILHFKGKDAYYKYKRGQIGA